ncbi:ABC transporter permease [Pantoea sp. EA-12]|uniref:ABC transporter permease n=1 Tax=Pantoea sp. EA-12 TaxID=3043303 RepID=UPI0024B57C25|nr:ABC transporter permease [Pantoea sp. EA-12]MDI9221067.1 ABC transporter permease [Pantoea sp. EA-12]
MIHDDIPRSEPPQATRRQRIWQRWKAFNDSDLVWLFWRSKSTVVAFTCCVLILFCSLTSHWIAPHNVFDTTTFDLMDSELPPAWMSGGDARFLFGTDVQGRDVLSLMLYGLNISLVIGISSVVISVALGVALGVLSGYFGGLVDTLIMRFADAMLSVPTIMFTLLVSGVARVAIPKDWIGHFAPVILIGAIALTGWMQYARTVRGLTLLEKGREYVMASRISGASHLHIMLAHIVPNVMRPVLVMATLHLGVAILTEATLSFLGVGMPPDQPSLGTLINEGNQYLFSGQWWIVVFPATLLVILSLSFNLLGDWLTDVLNPKLRQE